MSAFTKILGGCHCRNIGFSLDWPKSDAQIPVRECGCSFCVKHSGAWASNPKAKLEVAIADPALLSTYAFGTKTAQFCVCAQCGVVPIVLSTIEDTLYAAVNTNTFESHDRLSQSPSTSNFDDEGLADRLARRKLNWIGDVYISERSLK